MRRSRLALAVLALVGWIGALISHVVAVRAADTEAASGWSVTRNQFLLLSSLAMNTLVFSVLYTSVKKLARWRASRYARTSR